MARCTVILSGPGMTPLNEVIRFRVPSLNVVEGLVDSASKGLWAPGDESFSLLSELPAG